MFRRLVPGKINQDNIATPRYFFQVEEEYKKLGSKFLRAIEHLELLFVTKEQMDSINIDVEISFDEKTCVCVAQQHVLGVITGNCNTVLSFPDRVLIARDNGLLIAIHIGGIFD